MRLKVLFIWFYSVFLGKDIGLCWANLNFLHCGLRELIWFSYVNSAISLFVLWYIYIYLVTDSRARLVAGSFQGHTGHVDGKPSDARFNGPKGVTMDDKGNVYVADTSNLAIRKIGDSGLSIGVFSK